MKPTDYIEWDNLKDIPFFLCQVVEDREKQDLDFYAQVKAAAVEGGAKVHLASGAIGGFDVLQTVTLMAQAQGLPENWKN